MPFTKKDKGYIDSLSRQIDKLTKKIEPLIRRIRNKEVLDKKPLLKEFISLDTERMELIWKRHNFFGDKIKEVQKEVQAQQKIWKRRAQN